MIRNIHFLLGALALMTSACSSMRYGLDRRPFADKVAYMELKPSREPASAIGPVETKVCQGLLFSMIPMSDYPTFDTVKDQLVQKDIKYMTDVETSYGDASYAGIWKDRCLYLKGVAYK